jgi:putative NADPH-quinone reductase
MKNTALFALTFLFLVAFMSPIPQSTVAHVDTEYILSKIPAYQDAQKELDQLAKQYKKGADFSGADCKIINLIDLEFSPILKYGFRKKTELETDLINVQNDILESNHLVFVYPTWWGTQPAILKGFIDRVFL